jgi:hypothetical protein
MRAHCTIIIPPCMSFFTMSAGPPLPHTPHVQITFTVQGSQFSPQVSSSFPAGSYSFSLSNAVLGGPIPAGPLSGTTPLLKVRTDQDADGLGSYPGAFALPYVSLLFVPCLSPDLTLIIPRALTPEPSAIGGAVTATALTIAAPDRAASASNRKVVVTFTTTTALVCGDTVSITFPANFFAITYDGRFQSMASSFGLTAAAAITDAGINTQQSSTVFIVTATGSVPAGPQTVTLCGLTLNTFLTSAPCGVSVSTNKDWTTTFAATGTIGRASSGQVYAVSLSIPWSNRIAGATGQAATFAFSTVTPLLAGQANSITITFPNGFFAPNAVPPCGATAVITATGIPGYTFAATQPTSPTTFVLTSTAALPAAAYVMTFSGLTFGTATEGLDSGINVKTSIDTASINAPSGPLSGYQVTAFTLPTCVASVSQTCQSASVTFLSNADAIAPGSSLTITFSSSGSGTPILGTPGQFATQNGAIVTAGAVTAGAPGLRLPSPSAAGVVLQNVMFDA